MGKREEYQWVLLPPRDIHMSQAILVQPQITKYHGLIYFHQKNKSVLVFIFIKAYKIEIAHSSITELHVDSNRLQIKYMNFSITSKILIKSGVCASVKFSTAIT